MLISIIIPTFNRVQLIEESIKSVYDQKICKLECIVIDDHSTDDTKVVFESLSKKYENLIFKLRPLKLPKGTISCRNYGLKLASGKYVKFLDSDDILILDSLKEQIKILESNDKLAVCLAYGRFFDHSIGKLEEWWSRKTSSEDYLKDYFKQNIKWPIGGPLWRKSFFKKEPFNFSVSNGQEWLMHAKALIDLQSNQIHNLPIDVYLARRGHDNISKRINSSYYINRAKSRWLCLLYLLKRKPLFISHSIILIKSISWYLLLSVRIRFYKV
ncbi:glycosyltransferase family 2 protein [Algoriphagus halophytocola]|uniref:Glycosyltransferase family 2 protein n=1 Tax=Algoriphagus halophytocola TaxID=2991499 RepID=A0ABY6MNN5_9BACT|nr:glycosyltransferase family 2 protein [Algoriphagus sp. TR-M5]UZD23936.1 glycosyltransferase family 2 protein [Algoriphagus sp. TR-M5]